MTRLCRSDRAVLTSAYHYLEKGTLRSRETALGEAPPSCPPLTDLPGDGCGGYFLPSGLLVLLLPTKRTKAWRVVVDGVTLIGCAGHSYLPEVRKTRLGTISQKDPDLAE